MRLRIQLQTGRPIQHTKGKNRHLALATAALLIPLSLMAYVMGIWRLASDVGMAGNWGINGLFSHWQVWIAIGAVVQMGAAVLNDYGRAGEFHWPRFLSTLPFLRHRPRSS